MAKKRKKIPVEFEEDQKNQSSETVDQVDQTTQESENTEEKDKKISEQAKSEPESSPQTADAEIAEWKDRLIRLQAEFSNYKKRVEKESLELSNYLKAEIIKDFLPVLDDFKHMMQNVQHDHQDVKAVVDGMEMIFKKYNQVIEKYGVEKIDSLDSPFDPEMHEALMVQPVEIAEKDNLVIQVYKEGYKIKDKIIRPAQVIVGKYEETPSQAENETDKIDESKEK